MLEGYFKRFSISCFVFLASCQSIEDTNILYFKGYFNVENQNKQSYPVEIYIDSTRPVLRINILAPFGGVFASYLWNTQTHQVILPSKRQYFKQSKWPSTFPLQGLIQNPLWLYQALLKQLPKDWSCEETNKKLKKCSKNDIVIEWKKKFFRRDQIRISLKKERFSSKLSSYKSPSNVSWDMEIPPGFQQISTMDFIQ